MPFIEVELLARVLVNSMETIKARTMTSQSDLEFRIAVVNLLETGIFAPKQPLPNSCSHNPTWFTEG